MKKITATKMFKMVLGVTMAASMAIGGLFGTMPILRADASEGDGSSRDVKAYSVDMAMGLSGISDPVRASNSSGAYYVPSDYIYLGKNNRGAMLWRVLDSNYDNMGNEGRVFVMSEYLEAPALSGKNYDEAYLSYFSKEEKAILVAQNDQYGYSVDAFGREWTNGAYSGYLFAPSADEIKGFVSNYSEAPALRAFTDASRATVGSWWLRSEADGGVGYVDSVGTVDVQTNVANIQNYNRPAANIDPSSVVFSTRVDGGWRLALLDDAYSGALNEYDFSAWITDIDGNDLTISYVNAKPKDVSDAIREMISAIVVDADGNVKYYEQLGEVNYTEEKKWYGWQDHDKDGVYEQVSPAAQYPYHGSVKFNVSGVFDQNAGDKIYVFWEKAYSSRDIATDPSLAYQTTTTSKLVEICWHEKDMSRPATCTRWDTCSKCETQFGGFNYYDIEAHIDEDGKSGIEWEQRLGQYYTTDKNGNRYLRDGYLHFGYCKLCGHYLPMDENGYVSGASPCYCDNMEEVDCTNGAICKACGGYFTDVTMHSYDHNGICTRFTHFEEPALKDGFYEIKTVGNMIWYAQYANAQERYSDVKGAKLLRDIDFGVLKNYENEALKNFNWTPIGIGEYSFNTVIDGNGYEIRNLRCVSDRYTALGFVGWAQGQANKYPEVRNLGFVNCYFENTSTEQYGTGAIVGAVSYDLTVENCYVINTTVVGDKCVGGLVGYVWYGETIKNCYAIDLNILENGETVNSWIAGYCMGSPKNCFAYGENAGLLGALAGIPNPKTCYYLSESGSDEMGKSAKTAEQFASGLVAYYLGESYGQSIGEDGYPTLGGERVYRVSVCGEGAGKYTYSNTDDVSHVWDGRYVCGEAMTCQNCGEQFDEALEHSYTAIKGNASFIWDKGYGNCRVQTYCEHCDEANPELLRATVNLNFNGGVRADYVASIHIGEVKYTSDVVRIPIITIDEATGIHPSSAIFTGDYYSAIDLVTNTKMEIGEYEAYFLLDGEMVGEYARDAGVYDLHIVGCGRYDYQEYTYENFFTIEKVEVEMTVSVKDKIANGSKDFEIVLSFSNGVDYSYILGVTAHQDELPKAEPGEYTITGISYYFYDEEDKNNITITYNTTATARVLPRNYVEIINASYKLEYQYGDTVPAPKASDFNTDKGSQLTFTWFKDGVLLREVPRDVGTYTLRVSATATNEYIASSVEFEVVVNPKIIEIVVDPYGECETEIEDLGYDGDGDGKNDEKIWYVVGMGEIVPLYVVGLPGTDGPVPIDDERFVSTGYDIYWTLHRDGYYYSMVDGYDYNAVFPSVPSADGYNVKGSPHSENTFGISTNIAFYQYYNVEINVKVKTPVGELKPLQSNVETSGSAQDIELALTIPKWDVVLEDYDGSYGYPKIYYRTRISYSNNFDSGSIVNWYEASADFWSESNPSQTFKISGSGVIYVSVEATYTIYGVMLEDSAEMMRAKVTITVTDKDGNRVDEIVNPGTYTVTVVTEPIDESGEIIGDVAEHVTTYKVRNVTKEVYMIVKECEVNLDGTHPEFDIKDAVFLPGYMLDPGHTLVDLSYNITLGGYIGAFNMGKITVKSWKIVDEDGNDVSDEYVVYSEEYQWKNKYREVYGKDFVNDKSYGIVHVYSNACDATCNIDGCSKTREVEPHVGGTATCNSKAICDVCGNEYGGYDPTNHADTKTVYVRNPDDYRYHDLAYACCGSVIRTEAHDITKAATCNTLAECRLCGVVEGSYDYTKHTSTEMYYAQNPYYETMHDHVHKCCDTVETSGEHKGGEAKCTDLAVCDVCRLGYGKLDADNHSSQELKYTTIDTSTTRHGVSHACCGAYIETENHLGGEATCLGFAACEKCGAEYGDLDPANHASDDYKYYPVSLGDMHYIYHKCCGVEVGNEAHSGGKATCTSKAICEDCGAEYGEIDPANHASAEHTYSVNANDATKHDVFTACCGAFVSTEDHSNENASCAGNSLCQHCGAEFNGAAEHSYKDACDTDCDVCGAERLPGHKDADGNKVCDTCGAELGSKKSGCSGSVTGASIIAIMLTGAAIAFAKKKKED